MSTTGVTNTSPLIAFSAIQRLDLLENVFTRLLVPESVRAELFPTGSVWTQAQAAQEALTRGAWMEVIRASQPSALAVLTHKLGAGETEAIAVALERRLPLVIDDLEARAAARALGLQVVGTLGIVARNKKMQAIRAAKPVVEAIQQAGIYYSAALIERFLNELGEAK